MRNVVAAIKSFALFAWDVLIPRFVSEDVALRYVGDEITTDRTEWSAYEIVCCMEDVDWWETFDAIAEVDAFQWLGFGITYRIGNFRKWGAANA